MRIRVLLAAALVAGCVGAAFGQQELVRNGGFELPNMGEWQLTGGAAITNGPTAQSGVRYLTMGTSNNAYQVAIQTVTFPTNLIAATFSFDYEIVSQDNFTSDNTLSVLVLDTNQTKLANLGSASNTNRTIPPAYFFVATNLATYTSPTNVSPYAGLTVQLYFQVSTDPTFGALTTFNLDNVSMSVATTADIPANDNFANSIAIQTNITVTATNTFASKEPGEPNIAGNAGGHSLWWNWTAPTNGTATISTSGSTFTNLLGVFIGTSVSNLISVASRNGNNQDGTAQVSFKVAGGTQYQIAVDGVNGQTGTIDLNIKFVPDTTRPAVSIITPASGAKLTNSTVTVTGKATDNIAVAFVQYRLENASGTNDYQNADGTNSWSASVSGLVPGMNTIRVRAIDTSGNVSATATRTVNFIVVSLLTITPNGGGTVSPSLSGKLLAVGAVFTVTAKPSPGNIFAGWSGDLTTNSAKLVFTMQTNMHLEADFIPNPFPPVAGLYHGLFYDTNGVAHQSSGFVNLTVTPLGSYSGKILLAGSTYPVSGQFSAFGALTKSVATHSGPLALQLQLDLNGNSLTGQLSQGAWTAQLNAFRAMSNPPTGNYTLVLPGGDGDPEQPGGDGFGTLTVDGMGTLGFKGMLGDGTIVAEKTIVTPGGQWPFYFVYPTGNGSVLGWLTFTNLANGDISGDVSWTKLPLASKFYPGGFTNQNTAQGSEFQFPSGTPVPQPILTLPGGQGVVWLANGNLSSSFTNQITLNAGNKVVNQPGTTNALSLTITTSGLIKGSVVDPSTGKPVMINGVVLEKQNYATGFFPGSNQTGRFHLGPAE
ncbi:MAG: hypothetical protein C5B50_21010 [Verrucomicrobia bacterium]|nr:MAG: hypothetical protein C5B50_21010 [Verrucomicrobiota bacterium]